MLNLLEDWNIFLLLRNKILFESNINEVVEFVFSRLVTHSRAYLPLFIQWFIRSQVKILSLRQTECGGISAPKFYLGLLRVK